MTDDTKPDKPDPAGYNIAARILKMTSAYGEWWCATWDCPFCKEHYEFHGADHDNNRLAVSVSVIDRLNKRLQLRDTCDCGAKHYVSRELEIVQSIPDILKG